MIKILIPTCVWSREALIKHLRDNEDHAEVMIYGANNCETHIPKILLDGWFTIPRYDDPEFAEELCRKCKNFGIDVVIPTFDGELLPIARSIDMFNRAGVKVCISSLSSLEVVADKIALSEKYGQFMPRQMVATARRDLFRFVNIIGSSTPFCMKARNLYGGKGFVIVDNDKSADLLNHGVYCGKSYVDFHLALEIASNEFKKGHELILQEKIDGVDYSTNVLADHGKVILITGYESPMIQEGSALHAFISENEQAFAITKQIIEETGYDGNACFDFIKKPDGTVVLLEVNARINSNYPLVARAGYNLMWYRIVQLLGKDISHLNPKLDATLVMRRVYQPIYFNEVKKG